MSDLRTRTQDRRGASLILVAIALVVVMLMASLAIDLGRLLSARAEAQRAADAAAMAGVSAFLTGVSGTALRDTAVARAARIASQNEMTRQLIRPGELVAEGSYSEEFRYVETVVGGVLDTLESVDATVYPYVGEELRVEVIPSLERVRVTVRRDTVGVWFARVIGMREFPISARAMAHAAYAGGTRCVRPIAVMDWWDESDPDEDANNNEVPEATEVWDFDAISENDTYAAVTPTLGGTGLGSTFRNGKDGLVNDRGRWLILRNQGQAGQTNAVCADYRGNKCLGPGWWGLWDPWADEPKENASVPNIRRALTPTLSEENCAQVQVGHNYGFQQGEIGSLTKEFTEVWKSDPDAKWSTAKDPTSEYFGCVTRGADGSSPCDGDWRSGSRVWVMGLFDPNDAAILAAPGNETKGRVHFNNFALFFFEGCADPKRTNPADLRPDRNCRPQDDIVGRYAGIAPGIGPGSSVLTRAIRLVQ